jgi:CheY-like chemotaxis protein
VNNAGQYVFLLLEDNPLDAALVLRRLRDGGLAVDLTVVDSREAFVSAFDTYPFDMILADYSLPDFDGLTALDIVRARYGRLPFIFVSGVIGEEVAVDTMLRGATDFVLKSRLERLVPAVQRALKEHEEFLSRLMVETRLR